MGFFLKLELVFAVVALISYSVLWGPAVSRDAKIKLRRVPRAEHLTSPRGQQSRGAGNDG